MKKYFALSRKERTRYKQKDIIIKHQTTILI